MACIMRYASCLLWTAVADVTVEPGSFDSAVFGGRYRYSAVYVFGGFRSHRGTGVDLCHFQPPLLCITQILLLCGHFNVAWQKKKKKDLCGQY